MSIQTISVVVPVYQGEKTLPKLLEELRVFHTESSSPAGHHFRIQDVLLVHDSATDASDTVMQELEKKYDFVHAVWLSRNYGQHPATLAGMAGTSGEWIVTMDEDGQFNPADIGMLLDCALSDDAHLVYGVPRKPPHGLLRNVTSRLAKWISMHLLNQKNVGVFSSFRLVDGEIGRSLAAYCGPGVFLDSALSWVVDSVSHVTVETRGEGGRPSSYSYKKLFSHFWRLLLSSGTAPLRLIGILGVCSMLLAFGVGVYALVAKITSNVPVQGWTSLLIAVSFFSGVILLALSIIAEYLALSLGVAMGRPLYLVVSRPRRKPRS